MTPEPTPTELPPTEASPADLGPLFERIQAILTAARTTIARTVNSEMVRAY